jgi:predicted membrane protein
MGPYLLRGLLGIILVVGTVGAIARLNPRDAQRERDFTSTNASGKLESVVVFGEQQHHFVSTFRSGKVDTVLGQQIIDLTNATMDGSEAQIKVSVVFGEVQIRVPRGWTISRRHLGIVFGQMDDKTEKPSDGANAKTLVIDGGVVFGQVLVRN